MTEMASTEADYLLAALKPPDPHLTLWALLIFFILSMGLEHFVFVLLTILVICVIKFAFNTMAFLAMWAIQSLLIMVILENKIRAICGRADKELSRMGVNVVCSPEFLVLFNLLFVILQDTLYKFIVFSAHALVLAGKLRAILAHWAGKGELSGLDMGVKVTLQTLITKGVATAWYGLHLVSRTIFLANLAGFFGSHYLQDNRRGGKLLTFGKIIAALELIVDSVRHTIEMHFAFVKGSTN
jgi:hypothetical protein